METVLKEEPALSRIAGIPQLIVDVRSRTEFAAGHIPGAMNIPMDELEERTGDLMSDRPLLLVCQSGQRAGMCASLLAYKGIEAAVLPGGLKNCGPGVPLVVSVRTRWSLERQVRLGVGLLILASLLLTATAGAGWLGLTAFLGLGLVFAGCTDICLLGRLLSRMPWNRARR